MSHATKRCEVKLSDGKVCGRQLYGAGACIFHACNEDKNSDLFQEKLNEMLQDPSSEIYDFTKFIFPARVVFPEVFAKPAYFSEAVFRGSALFGNRTFRDYADFREVVFEGDADFMNAKFECGARFWRGTFAQDANFRNIRVEGQSVFDEVVFRGGTCFNGANLKEVEFGNSDFQQAADFRDMAFGGDANFHGAKFKGWVSFLSAAFYAGAYFSATIFEKKTIFLDSTFCGRANFWRAVFGDEAWFGSSAFQYVLEEDSMLVSHRMSLALEVESLNNTSFQKDVDFTAVTFSKPSKVYFQKIDLSRFRFLQTDLREVHFSDEQWGKARGRISVYDEIGGVPHSDKLDYPLIAQIYKRLRANYETNLRYSEAGDFYIGEMEMTRRAERSVFKKLPLLFYKVISNYGESYYRPLCWIAVILLLFPLLFMFAGIQPATSDPGTSSGQVIIYELDFSSLESVAPTWDEFGDYYTCFLYSMSVFSFIRDKKYTTTNNGGHTIFVAESILGPITLAFFLLALRRRFKR